MFLLVLDHLIPHLHVGTDQAEGESKRKAFQGGVLSGVVEPIGAVMTILAAQLVIPALHIYLALQQEPCYMSWLKN